MSEHQSEPMLTLHEDAFYEFFRPYRHARAQYDIWGGLGLETFGEDFELVKQLPATHVWTVVDGGDTADQWIVNAQGKGVCQPEAKRKAKTKR